MHVGEDRRAPGVAGVSHRQGSRSPWTSSISRVTNGSRVFALFDRGATEVRSANGEIRAMRAGSAKP